MNKKEKVGNKREEVIDQKHEARKVEKQKGEEDRGSDDRIME